MVENYIIKFDHVSKNYTTKCDKSGNFFIKKTNLVTKKVLEDVSFEVYPGQVVGIIGLNGSGKSTLLKLLANIITQDDGDIIVNGTIASILELGMGFHQDLTGRENIYLKAEMYGFSKSQINEMIEEIIDYSGIRDSIDLPLRTYSSGMAGRLAFSIMVHLNADVFLIDEILSIGDSFFSAKASQYFKKIINDQKTVLLVSHSLSAISEMCTRAIWIDNGHIREDGDPKIICAHYKRNIFTSFDINFELANSGVPEAQYRIYEMYNSGIGVQKNKEEAIKWLESSANLNYIPALLKYAEYLSNLNLTDNHTQIVDLYVRAAELGNSDARKKLTANTGNKDNIPKYIEKFEMAVKYGDPVQQFQYGMFLHDNACTSSDYVQAIDWLDRASTNLNTDAMLELGNIYRYGRGVDKNIELAYQYLNRAAMYGNIRAQMCLADAYTDGKEVDKNDKIAFKWCLEVAKTGNMRYQYRLAESYRDGIGTAVNIAKSKEWFDIYNMSSYSQHLLVLFNYLKSSMHEQDCEQLLVDASKSYNFAAMLKIGILYGENPNYGPNTKFGLKCLENVAKHGNSHACYTLGNFYLKKSDKNNLELAKYWLLMAHGGGSALASFELYKLTSDDKYLIIAANRGLLDAKIEYSKKMFNGIS